MLFADSLGSVDQEGGWKGVLQACTCKGLEKRSMAPMVMEPHGVRERGLSHWMGSMAWGAPPAIGALIWNSM